MDGSDRAQFCARLRTIQIRNSFGFEYRLLSSLSHRRAEHARAGPPGSDYTRAERRTDDASEGRRSAGRVLTWFSIDFPNARIRAGPPQGS